MNRRILGATSVILAALLLPSANGAEPERLAFNGNRPGWIAIFSGGDSAAFMHIDSLKSRAGGLRGWLMMNYRIPRLDLGPAPVWSQRSWVDIDCPERTLQISELTAFPQIWAEGKRIRTTTPTIYEAMKMAPETTGWHVVKNACDISTMADEIKRELAAQAMSAAASNGAGQR